MVSPIVSATLARSMVASHIAATTLASPMVASHITAAALASPMAASHITFARLGRPLQASIITRTTLDPPMSLSKALISKTLVDRALDTGDRSFSGRATKRPPAHVSTGGRKRCQAFLRKLSQRLIRSLGQPSTAKYQGRFLPSLADLAQSWPPRVHKSHQHDSPGHTSPIGLSSGRVGITRLTHISLDRTPNRQW